LIDLPESEVELLEKTRETEPPGHIAVIMDGNGRWARARHLPRPAGHRAGMKSVRRVTEACIEAGVNTLTLFAFSRENWNRPRAEVSALMVLLEHYVASETGELKSNGVEVHILGDRSRLNPSALGAVERVERDTIGGANLQLNVCLSYSSREEIVRAARLVAEDVSRGVLRPEDISEETIASRLYTAPWGDPDLLIRTSGEFRISNFLLWQLAYAELHVTSVLWPDFSKSDLYRAVLDYQGRERRFGGVTAQ
jgi:undecaprenyl diphosphate synthase